MLELTPAVMFGAITTLTSLLVATWALSRRSRDWDEADRLRKIIDGEPDRGKAGILRDVDELTKRTIPQLENIIKSNTEQIKWLKYGLDAHGSDEHVVVAAIRDSITDRAREMAKDEYERAKKETARLRNVIVDQQRRRMGEPRGEESFVSDVMGEIDDDEPPQRRSETNLYRRSDPNEVTRHSQPDPFPSVRPGPPRPRALPSAERAPGIDPRRDPDESGGHRDRESHGPREPRERDSQAHRDTGRHEAARHHPPKKDR